MNPYYDSIVRLYKAGKITAEQVALAVAKNLINAAEYEQITGNNS